MAISTSTAEQSGVPFGAVSTPVKATLQLRRNLREGLVIFGIWIGLALLSAGTASLNRLNENQTAEWTRSIVLMLIDHGILAADTCLLLWMVRRWPLGMRRWRFAPFYLATIVPLCIFKYFLYVPIRHFLYPALPAYHSILEICFYEVFELGAVVAILHSIEYGRSLRQARLRASQLETNLANARLEVLRSELQPHFLFNALHSISTLMHRDVEAADEVLTQVGDLLRLSLQTKAVQEVPLREELAILQRYLNIVRIRFGDRLTISVNADPSVLEARVPLFILQPLVENAIHHGIAQRSGAGKIAITARGVSDSIEIAISDDGPGLPSDSVAEGIGLSNTRSRLEQLYGPRGRIALKGQPGVGAQAIVTIPRTRGELRLTP